MSIFFNVPKFKTLLVQQAYAVNVLNQCRSILWGWGWPIKFNIPQNNWWIVTRWPFYCIPQILCGYTQNCWSYSYASGPTFFFNLFIFKALCSQMECLFRHNIFLCRSWRRSANIKEVQYIFYRIAFRAVSTVVLLENNKHTK